MSFKYSVIGDNTPENREWLEKVGYQMHGDYRKHNDFIFSFEATDVSIPMYRSLYEHEIEPFYKNELNCIGNPQLFRAVTAIRDDSDHMQWFTDGKSWLNVPIGCDLAGFLYADWDGECGLEDINKYHKATFEELKEHFQRV